MIVLIVVALVIVLIVVAVVIVSEAALLIVVCVLNALNKDTPNNNGIPRLFVLAFVVIFIVFLE